MKKKFITALTWSSMLFLICTSFLNNVQAQTIYPGDSVKLSVTNTFRGTIVWQESVDGTNWTNIPNAITNNKWIKPTRSIKYRAKITEANCDPVYSSMKTITIDTSPELQVITNAVTEIIPGLSNANPNGPGPSTSTGPSASAGGTISRNRGNTNVVLRGICWNTAQNPTIFNYKAESGNGLGTFTTPLVSPINGINSGTTYYIRAFVITDNGETLYGNQVTFTAPPQEQFGLYTWNASQITINSARLDYRISGQGSVKENGICWSTHPLPTIKDFKKSNTGVFGDIMTKVTGLQEGTKYYVRSYAITNAGYIVYGNEVVFNTPRPFEVLIYERPDAKAVSTTVNCNAIITGTPGTITNKGVCWSTSPNPTVADSKTANGSGAGMFTATLTDLKPNTTYYVKAYVTTSTGKTIYSGYAEAYLINEAFYTKSPFDAETMPVENITGTTAKTAGNVRASTLVEGTITARGICWSTSPTPTEADKSISKLTPGLTGFGRIDYTLTGLLPNTKYYVRSFGKSSLGMTMYGQELSFTTTDGIDIITSNVTDITAISAKAGGSVNNSIEDLQSVVERGICWSTHPSPFTYDEKSEEGSGTGAFTSSLSELLPGTKYYVRAYAITNIGQTKYGNEVSFTTLKEFDASVTTANVSSITATGGTSGGTINVTGLGSITSRGICWSNEQNPTVDDDKLENGSGPGSFTGAISSLNPGTTYYVRAYAISDKGVIFYGNQQSFVPPTPLTITTTVVSNITPVQGISGGNITAVASGTSITVKGVCWATSPNPTITNYKTLNGTGAGSFQSLLSNLIGTTTYYVRAYATTNTGITVYGNMVSFQTTQAPPTDLTVVTKPLKMISITTASVDGNISGTSSVVARGVCWSKSPDPTIGNSKTADGTGIGAFSSALSGLEPATQYYLRAYATASNGSTTYGNQIQFTTAKSADEKPVVITRYVTAISTTTALISAEITNIGVGAPATNGTMRDRGVCLSINPAPTVRDLIANTGGLLLGDNELLAPAKNLLPGTKYYARAFYRDSEDNITYGNELSFTTLVQVPTGLSVKTLEAYVVNNQGESVGDYVFSGGIIEGPDSPISNSLTNFGYCWSKSPNPTVENSSKEVVPVTSYNNPNPSYVFPIFKPVSYGNMISPEPVNYASAYYLRAFITLKSGAVVYGNQITFTTPPAPRLVVNSQVQSSDVNYLLNSSISPVNGATETIIARGACWSKVHKPTIADSRTIDGAGTENLQHRLTLEYETYYFIRAYATTSSGTTYYGKEYFFQKDTPEQTAPPVLTPDPNPNPNPSLSVTTNAATSITTNSAILSGKVSGSGNITDKGICWSTSQNPTKNNSRFSAGSGMGSFSGKISGLAPGKRYYARAYAVSNSGAITYGAQITFVMQSAATGGGSGDMIISYVVYKENDPSWSSCKVSWASNAKGYRLKVINSKNLKAEKSAVEAALKSQYGSGVDLTYKSTYWNHAAVVSYLKKIPGYNCTVQRISVGFGKTATEALNHAIKLKNGEAGSSTPYKVEDQLSF